MPLFSKVARERETAQAKRQADGADRTVGPAMVGHTAPAVTNGFRQLRLEMFRTGLASILRYT
jgi:hypothetical protein